MHKSGFALGREVFIGVDDKATEGTVSRSSAWPIDVLCLSHSLRLRTARPWVLKTPDGFAGVMCWAGHGASCSSKSHWHKHTAHMYVCRHMYNLRLRLCVLTCDGVHSLYGMMEGCYAIRKHRAAGYSRLV